MQVFKLSKDYSAVCISEGTRSGFRHVAHLIKNGNGFESVKICYLNRTWESYQFETVLHKLVNESNIIEGRAKGRLNARIRSGKFLKS
jgi:spore maturation protein CgeB